MSHDQAEKIIAAASGAVMAVCGTLKKIGAIAIWGKIQGIHIDYSQLLQVSLNAAVGAIVGLSVKWVWDKSKRLFKTKKQR